MDTKPATATDAVFDAPCPLEVEVVYILAVATLALH